MTINIGYLTDRRTYNSGPLTSDPAFHPRRSQLVDGKRTRHCPAISDYHWSAFDVYVPYSLSFQVICSEDGQFGVSIDNHETTVDHSWLRSSIELTFADEGTVQVALHPFWIFISDDPDVIVTQLPAHNQTNPHPIRGQFNCYNWFRPITYAFEFKIGEKIVITDDSPIFQVKFYHPSETKFVLRECEMTPAVAKIAEGSGLRGFNRKTNWQKVFNFSRQRRPLKVLEFPENSHSV